MTLVSLTTVGPAGSSRQSGLQLFASGAAEPRARRPTDVALAVLSGVTLLLCVGLRQVGADFERALVEVVDSLPDLVEPLWRLSFWLPVGYAVSVIVAAVVRRRAGLARDLVAAAVLSVGIAVAVGTLLVQSDRRILDVLVDANGPPVFPPGMVAVTTAVIATASPHLSLWFRHLGRWSIGSQLLAAVFAQAAVPSGALGALAAGALSAALVHLAVGSPGGRPTAARIREALADLSVEVESLAPAAMQSEGVVLLRGRDRVGPLVIKVYGRDAWDAQLLTTLWRRIWYRGSDPATGLRRINLVEHEAFMTLLAERAGATVPGLVTAGSAGLGDALVVLRPRGVPLVEAGSSDIGRHLAISDVSSIWREVLRLHDNGIVHRRLDLDRVVLTPDGSLGLGDLSTASVASDATAKTKDLAQLTVLSLLMSDEPTAVATARRIAGDQQLAATLPMLQEAAMPPLMRAALDDQGTDLDDFRSRLSAELGAGDQDLIRLRRVTWGSVVNLVLLLIAASSLIGLLGGLDLGAFVDALDDASWWWLAFAVVLAQLPRIPAAVSTLGACSRPLPLGPVTALQFAICYVNLAIPSTAARVAINIRFFQRLGVPPAVAVSAGVIDSMSGFVVQIVLFLVLLWSSDTDVSLSVGRTDLSGLATIAAIVIGVLVVAVVVLALVPSLRAKVTARIAEAREALSVLKSPSKLLQLFGGNLLGQVMFGIAVSACVQAFGYEVPLSRLILINTVVSLFAGLLPVPGGIGVSEAGLTLGLTRAGLPTEIAFAVALAYRFATFYLPPIWGWLSYRWLIRHRLL